MKRVIGYVRVSTDKQDRARQKALITEYCANNNYILVDCIGESESGAKADREVYHKILDTDNTVADMLVVSEMSRLSREDDILKVLNDINQIIKNGLDVYFLDEPNKLYPANETLKMMDIILLTVKAQANADERKRIALRTKTGKYTLFKKNEKAYLGGFIPYGFEIVPNPARAINETEPASIIVPTETIKNVKVMYEMIIQGNTMNKVAQYLNSIGEKSTFSQKDFTASTIDRIVKNPIYKGERIFTDIKMDFEPIVSEEVFNNAMLHLKNNQLIISKGKNFNPLKGIVKCPCGYGMQYHKKTVNKNSTFACAHKYHYDKYNCGNYGINAEWLFEAVWKTVKSTLQLSKYQKQSNDASKKYDIQLVSLNEKKNDLLKDRNCISEEKRKIINAIKNASLASIIKELEADYISTEKREKELNNRIDSINKVISEIRDKQNKLQNIISNTNLEHITQEEKREIYINELDTVIYYSVTTARGFIILNFKNGIQNILVVKKKRGGYIAQLPASFSFNAERRTVIAQISKIQKINMGYSLPEIEYKEYTFQELEKAFDLLQWDIYVIHRE